MTNENTALLITILIGLALIVIGIFLFSRYNKLIRSGINAEGTIIGFETSSGEDGITYFPKVSYTTIQNEQIIKKYVVGYNTQLYKIGDTVPVLYDAADNSIFIIADKRTKFTGPTFFIIGTVIISYVIAQHFFYIFPLEQP